MQDMLMNEVMLFEPAMKQSYLQKQFDCKFYSIATITFESPIEFFVKKMLQSYNSI